MNGVRPDQLEAAGCSAAFQFRFGQEYLKCPPFFIPRAQQPKFSLAGALLQVTARSRRVRSVILVGVWPLLSFWVFRPDHHTPPRLLASPCSVPFGTVPLNVTDIIGQPPPPCSRSHEVWPPLGELGPIDSSTPRFGPAAALQRWRTCPRTAEKL
jgi:hypothetical protein